jgi:hypothetical protein
MGKSFVFAILLLWGQIAASRKIVPLGVNIRDLGIDDLVFHADKLPEVDSIPLSTIVKGEAKFGEAAASIMNLDNNIRHLKQLLGNSALKNRFTTGLDKFLSLQQSLYETYNALVRNFHFRILFKDKD